MQQIIYEEKEPQTRHDYQDGQSEIHLYSHYEEDPEKARQAKEEFDRGLRYIAKQGGWLDVLEERDASLMRLMCLFKEIEERHAKMSDEEKRQNALGMWSNGKYIHY